MAKKQFKTESKKLLDMMVNSIYTHKDIFLRELISNASDAIDKLYFRSLTDDTVKLTHSDYEIRLSVDKNARSLTIADNGCGMSKDELENNLGTIAKSDSFDFKNDPENKNGEQIDIIGQFGVGFYSAFMVADRITVESRVYGSDEAYCWESSGADGYTINPCEKETAGTVITICLKADTDDEKYSDYLEEYRLRSLVKKYSDYIRYPIRMQVSHSHLKEGTENKYETVTEDETLNSMVPLWKKSASEVTEEEYAQFYQDKYFDYEAPLKVIRQKAEGTSNYEALMFIPAHAPFDYYSKDFEKGLQLYSRGVLIMEKCKDLLPDHFSFVRGLVDSSDLSLNISREMLQQDRQLKIIAKALEKKIAGELKKMLENEREKYEQFFKAFGAQLKWGIYSSYGTNKDTLQDLILFKSSLEGNYVTLKEYVSRMKEGQEKIYYAYGDSVEKISLLPQVESVIGHGYEVLYLTEDIDEFALQMLRTYDEKEFLNVCEENLDLASEDEKEKIKAENDASAEMFWFMKESIGDNVSKVRFTNTLQNHPVSLSSEGNVSMGMEKVLNKMPGTEDQHIKAEIVLEININHPLAAKLKELFENDKDKLATYSKILFAQARLVSGMTLDNPAEISSLVCDLML
ncbi:MAG: molecular chaperone HtpG [Ruminococcaceae bacterium]|nr:molecular chaperone HtpG [Oscillospiraceae bacterium]